MSVITLFLLCAAYRHCKAYVPYIAGGLPASRYLFPFVVSIQDTNPAVYEPHFCGGSIIASKWILTAGHCCADRELIRPAYSMEVVVGTTDLNSDEGSRHSIRKVYLHPEYNKPQGDFENDIALLLLQVPIQFSRAVSPIMLGSLPPEDGRTLVTMGWGDTSEPDGGTSRLMYAVLESMGPEQCQRRCDLLGAVIKDQMEICAWGGGWGGEGKSVCSGDSGGPLIDCQTWTQVGIVAAAVDCTGRIPALFTKVETYWSWIRNVTHPLKKKEKSRNVFLQPQ